MDPINPPSEVTSEALHGTPLDAPGAIQSGQTPKDNHWITILSMALFVLLSLGAVAFLYYQNQQLKSMLASYQTVSSPTPSASQAPNGDLANWKTYTDSRYNFSFKYPPSWKIMSLGSSYKKVVLLLDLQKDDPRFTNCKSEGPCENSAHIQFNVGMTDLTTKDFDFAFWGNGYPIAKTNNSLINGIKVVQVFNTNESLIPNGTLYKVRPDLEINATSEFFNYNDKNNSTDYSKETIQEIDQILSTFKFLGPTATCKPRPACLDATPRCLIPETSDMCPPSPTPSAKACTMEAKLCPNGSYVGRTGPNCEFTPCP